MLVKDGFLEEATSKWQSGKGQGGCLQWEPGKSILGRRNSRVLRLVSLCRLCLLEPGFRKARDESRLVSWAGVRVQ